MWNFFTRKPPPVSSSENEPNLVEIVEKQEHTIKILETQIIYLKDEISLLKIAIIEQRSALEKSFDTQKQCFIEGIKQILLTLENERLNNDRLLLEIDGLREKNDALKQENMSLRHRFIP